VASGPDQPPAGPSRLTDSLARHRWVAAAGMTATIAAVAGGGLALALHDSSARPPKQCGLVPCAAALPASVQTSGDGSASAPATAAPTAAQRAPTPPSPTPSPTSPARSAAAPSAAAPSAAVPEAAAAPDQPASAGRVSVPEPRFSCTTVIAFMAGDPLSPVRCRFTAAARHQRSRDGAGHPRYGAARQDNRRAGSQLGSGQGGHDDWPGSWPSGWLSRGWSGGGWSGGGWSGGGWSGGGWSGGGWSGQHGGWPGGR
jgi:hypothetical protein